MAQLTANIVQQENSVQSYGVTGTPVQTETFLVQVTKAAQNDTIVTTAQIGSRYETSNIIALDGVTIPAGGDTVQEAPTVDDSDDEIVLPSATTGTSWVKITFGF